MVGGGVATEQTVMGPAPDYAGGRVPGRFPAGFTGIRSEHDVHGCPYKPAKSWGVCGRERCGADQFALNRRGAIRSIWRFRSCVQPAGSINLQSARDSDAESDLWDGISGAEFYRA